MHSRLKLLASFFLIAFLLLIGRLFFWQVIKGKSLASQARSQYQKSEKITAPRGNILSSDESYFAGREEAYLVYAYLPDIVEEHNLIADKLAPLLADGEDEDNYKARILDEAGRIKTALNSDGAVWVPLKHKVSYEIKVNIEALKIEGIGFEDEEIRVYPEASSGAHLLGFVGKDDDGGDIGYFGLEGFYDQILSGKQGYVSRESDARGLPILIGNLREVNAVNGVNLLTYIDKTVQHTVENALAKGLEKYGAASGTVIVMDPKTGGILAQASYPS